MQRIKLVPLYSRLLIFNLFIFQGCLQNAEDSIFLVTEGFEGNIIIVFHEKNGAKPEYQNGVRVYRIPKNGVLKTQFTPNYGTRRMDQFYFYNGGSQGHKIPYLLSLSDTSRYKKNETIIFNKETGKSGEYHFLVFSVTTVENLDSIANRRGDTVRKTVRPMTNENRK
jgi:hypothetical protein